MYIRARECPNAWRRAWGVAPASSGGEFITRRMYVCCQIIRRSPNPQCGRMGGEDVCKVTHMHTEVTWAPGEVVASYKPREETSAWNLPCQHLDLRLPSFQNCEKSVVFKPFSLVFCCGTWADAIASECGTDLTGLSSCNLSFPWLHYRNQPVPFQSLFILLSCFVFIHTIYHSLISY